MTPNPVTILKAWNLDVESDWMQLEIDHWSFWCVSNGSYMLAMQQHGEAKGHLNLDLSVNIPDLGSLHTLMNFYVF